MSDALLTRIAEALEGLLHHAKTGAAVPADKPAKTGKAAKAAPVDPSPAAQTDAPAAAATAQPAAATTPPPSAAAPVAAPAPSVDLVNAAANAVIDLANNFSRDAAVEEMAKFGAQKVSQVKPQDLAALLNNVTVRIAAEKAKKANESLV